ncbi:cyclic nucleotide-binding domain-containing protein [bacterium]|nr:cyclic nucleotide-binding domain-containing protein [bacterium]
MKLDLPKEFTRVYKKSELIFEESSQGNEMYVVSSGKVKISTNKSGKEFELATLGEGEFFGEMSLVDSEPRVAKATSAEDNTTLIILDKAKFLHMVSQQPDFALTIINTLCHRIREIYKLYSDDNPKRAVYDYQKLITLFASHRAL